MVVGAGLRIWFNRHRTSPQLLSARYCVSDGCGTMHSRCLRCIAVRLASLDDADSSGLPVRHARYA